MTWWNDLPPDRQELIESVLTERQVVVLKARMDGHPLAIIAKSLGITEPTARIHYERALSKLAPYLQPKEPA